MSKLNGPQSNSSLELMEIYGKALMKSKKYSLSQKIVRDLRKTLEKKKENEDWIRRVRLL